MKILENSAQAELVTRENNPLNTRKIIGLNRSSVVSANASSLHASPPSSPQMIFGRCDARGAQVQPQQYHVQRSARARATARRLVCARAQAMARRLSCAAVGSLRFQTSPTLLSDHNTHQVKSNSYHLKPCRADEGKA